MDPRFKWDDLRQYKGEAGNSQKAFFRKIAADSSAWTRQSVDNECFFIEAGDMKISPFHSCSAAFNLYT